MDAGGNVHLHLRQVHGEAAPQMKVDIPAWRSQEHRTVFRSDPVEISRGTCLPAEKNVIALDSSVT